MSRQVSLLHERPFTVSFTSERCAGPLCLPARAYHPCESSGLSSPIRPPWARKAAHRQHKSHVSRLSVHATNQPECALVVRAARVPLYLGRLVWFSSFIEQCNFPFLTVSTHLAVVRIHLQVASTSAGASLSSASKGRSFFKGEKRSRGYEVRTKQS